MNNMIAQLRAVWRTTIEGSGGHCPVCNRWGKVYARPVNRTMARSLIWLAHATTNAEGWVDVPKSGPRWLVQSNQLPTLRWWGLVARKENEGETNTKHSGYWCVTDKGLDFLNNGARIPKKVFTYNDTVEAYSAETVTIRDCFKDNFDYQATMTECAGSAIATTP